MSADDGIEAIRWEEQSDDGQVMLSLPWEVFVLGLAILSIVNLAMALMIPALRVARLLRVVRVARVIGHMGGPSAALRAFFANRATGGLMMVLLIAVLVLEFGALSVLWAEQDAPGATILTAEDAIWYMVVTMSTVGYGDLAPVTSIGRLIGSLIILVGVGVFGTLTGFLANAFMAPPGDTTEHELSEPMAASVE